MFAAIGGWGTVLVLSPFVVYLGARVVFAAYFHAKRDFLRRLFTHGTAQGQDHDRG